MDRAAILEFHRSLPGYAPTPLVDATSTAARLGLAHVWVKNEAHRFDLGAYKILGAAWAASRALARRGHGDGPFELVAASEGNHGRAVARAARWLGAESHIFVPRTASEERMERIRREQARLTIVDTTYDDAVNAAAAYAEGPRRLLISDTGLRGGEESPRDVVDGYSTLFREIDDQLAAFGARRPALAVVQMGVGALAAAAVSHYPRDAGATRLIGVEPEGADCIGRSLAAGRPVEAAGPYDSRMAGMNCGRVSLTAWPLLRTGLDACVAIPPATAELAAGWLADDDVVSTPTGAAGLAGLRQWLAARPAGEVAALRDGGVLLIATEGAS